MDRARCGLSLAGVALAVLMAACGAPPEPGAMRDDARPPVTGPNAARPPGGTLQLRVADGLVTLHADDVTLGAILRELERQGGLRLVSRDDLHERMSLDVERQPLPVVLRQLLPTRDFLLLQGPAHSTLFIHGAGSPALSPVLLPSAVPGDIAGRLEAIAALPRAAGGEDVRTLGVAATLDEVADVREDAAAALGDIGGAEAQTALATALSDPDPQVRAAAVHALGRLGGDAAVQALGWALAQGAGRESLVAIDAIGRIGGAAAAGALRAATQHGDPLVRQAAAEWLEEYAGTSPGAPAGAILRP